MKETTNKTLLAWMLLIFIVANSQAITPVFYDSEKQAIGIDPYADGWGGYIGIDFNNDHSSAGFIEQGLDGGIPYDQFTTLGAYKSLGNSTHFYYGSLVLLSELQITTNTIIDIKAAAEENGDMIRYFVDEWNFAESKTIIYAQPINSAGFAIPVLESDLDNIYYENKYYFTDPSAWQPIPEPTTLFLFGLGGLLMRKPLLQ
jgi:hypothetical protein